MNFRVLKLLSLFVFFTSIHAYGQRSVTLTAHGPESGIQITNPSNVSVNFDVNCFDAGGTQTVNQTGNVLASQNTHYVGGPTCAPGYSLDSSSSSYPDPIYVCKKDSGNVNFSGAQAACAGNNLCTLGQIQTEHGYNMYNSFAYWFVPGVANWSYDNTGSYAFVDVADGTGTRALTTSSTYSNWCKNEPAAGSAGYSTYCAAPLVSFGAAGSLCCMNSSGLAYCKVTINSTDPNAYLTSPNFKGGAPF